MNNCGAPMAQILKDQCKARDSGALARVKFTNFIIHNQGGLTDEVESIFHSFICPKFLTSFGEKKRQLSIENCRFFLEKENNKDANCL